MPEGRMLSRSIAHSEQLGLVPLEADYLFARCIPHLDRDGRMAGNPELVKSIACPLRVEINSGSIPDLLRSLAAEGLVRWYEVGGRQVLEFPQFAKHQKGFKYDREAESRFPAYGSDGCVDLLRTNSGPDPDEVRPSKVKLSEVQVNTTSPIGEDAASASVDDEVEYAECEVIEPGPDEPRPSLVLALRPSDPVLPFDGLDADEPVNGGQIMAAWVRWKRPSLSKHDRGRMAAAGQRLADGRTMGEVRLAMVGMDCIWPYAPPSLVKGSEGRAWDLMNLERDFNKALAGAANHPVIRKAREDAEWEAAFTEDVA